MRKHREMAIDLFIDGFAQIGKKLPVWSRWLLVGLWAGCYLALIVFLGILAFYYSKWLLLFDSGFILIFVMFVCFVVDYKRRHKEKE